MRVLLELLRIIFIFALLGGLAWMIVEEIYSMNAEALKYQWVGAIGIYTLLFVLYRNRLQFSGWYKGKGGKKLPKKVSFALICVAMLMLITPILIRLVIYN